MKEERTELFWRSLEEKRGDPELTTEMQNEFPMELASSPSRRDFLKTLGFGMTGAMVACSRMPVEKVIPYLVQPENIVPGKAYWYASTCHACPSQCGTLVKTREGRPIKMEGNALSSVSQGGLCAKGQASVLDLYDSGRLHGPLKNGKPVQWNELDEELRARFNAILKKGGRVRVLSRSFSSPTLNETVQNFLGRFKYGKHISYDPISYSALIQAQKYPFGVAIAPQYHFDRADLIVSFSADFLGTWLSPVQFAKDYAKRRKLNDKKASMSRHIQFESRLSLTGANADERIPVTRSEEKLAVAALYYQLKALSKGRAAKKLDGKNPMFARTFALAEDLHAKRGSSIVLSSSNRRDVQKVIAKINILLGNYGKTLSLGRASLQRKGDDYELQSFLAEVREGGVDALILLNANPLYDLPLDGKTREAFAKIDLIVSMNSHMDESASKAHYHAPDLHSLESWGDSEPVRGSYHLTQPLIHPIYSTRQAGETFLRWQGRKDKYDDVLRSFWRKNLFSKQTKHSSFKAFWRQSLHDGVFEESGRKTEHVAKPWAEGKDVRSILKSVPVEQKSADFELELYESVAIGEGNLANNPWLQELPDPVTKLTWDNYATVSIQDANRLNLSNGDLVSLKAKGLMIDLPVYIQPGQAKGVLSAALGYGRTKAGKAGNGVGKNLYPWVSVVSGERHFERSGIRLKKLGKVYPLALTQTHHSAEGRPIVFDLTQKDLKEKKNLPKKDAYDQAMLWEDHHPEHHAWGMAIDLSSCTGCSSCLVSCQAENNVPVVGKEEVRTRREMSWIRIDRYYKGDETNPDVVFQPMLCQHCGNAPCESVCPVLATVHSSDGLNQQVYNRCIGTRYCANNCAYKVRRFNWFDYAKNNHFDYHMNDEVGRLVLNPDVVVRSRGVMEKCSLCVQRIQESKLEAKKDGSTLNSDEIKTACQQSCPADAIVFGDLNDPKSRLAKLVAKEPRRFHVLAELNVQPSITYLAKVRNKA